MLDSPESVIRSKLEDDETLVWSGVPKQGLLLRPTDAVVIPVSLLWGGFALYWEYEVVTTHQFWVLQVWGIPFVLIGLFLIVGRFFVDASVRGRTYYGLTDKRILIVVGDKLQSYPISDISGIAIKSGLDRVGTIIFGVPGTPVPTQMNTVLTSSRVKLPDLYADHRRAISLRSDRGRAQDSEVIYSSFVPQFAQNFAPGAFC
ncbi:MAG TPA: hypothetical protein VGX02_07565 [Candidatus Eremiobacteraceae bacterium]|nr:hypothetical protein [Candidatus Eremiobacteraceae bacterium]